jgi:hypothetical protein
MKTILIVLLLLPLAGIGQKVKVHQTTDRFTKQQIISTNGLLIKNRTGITMAASLHAVDSVFVIILAGSGYGTGVIGSDDHAIFLLDNDDTVRVKSTGLQSYEIGDVYAIGKSVLSIPNYYSHQYIINKNQLRSLSQHNLKAVRKNYNQKYIDIDIVAMYHANLRKLSSAFLQELEKAGL